VFGLHGRSAEQRIAIDLLWIPRSASSRSADAREREVGARAVRGPEAVLERQQQKKIIVFRPLFAVGGQELGYLPGDQSEKMNPWGQAVFDTLGSVVSGNVLEEVVARGCSRCCRSRTSADVRCTTRS
jgi:PhoH-like ATPase